MTKNGKKNNLEKQTWSETALEDMCTCQKTMIGLVLQEPVKLAKRLEWRLAAAVKWSKDLKPAICKPNTIKQLYISICLISFVLS